MYWLSYFYLNWINFWRLPETEHTLRVNSSAHRQKLSFVRIVWIVSLMLLGLIGQPVVLMVGVVLLTFLSFMFLDEV